MIVEGAEQGGDLLAHEAVALHHEAVESAVDAEPRLTVLLDVADGHVEHAPGVGVVVDAVDLAVVVEGDERHAAVVDDPDAPQSIVIAADGGEHEQLLKFRVVGDDGLHRSEVKDVHALVEGHPEAVEAVFGDAAARLAVEVEVGSHDAIAVVAHQSATIGRDPEESAGVHVDIADVVVGETIAQVERREVIEVGEGGSWD